MSRKRRRALPSAPSAKLDKSTQVPQTVAVKTATSVVKYSLEGPLPPPQILKAYDIIQPGFAERIFSMAEKQSDHRRRLEQTVIGGDSKRAWWGMGLGFLITVAVLCVSYSLIMGGHDLSGATIAVADLAGLAGVFVYGSRARTRERRDRIEKINATTKPQEHTGPS